MRMLGLTSIEKPIQRISIGVFNKMEIFLPFIHIFGLLAALFSLGFGAVHLQKFLRTKSSIYAIGCSLEFAIAVILLQFLLGPE